MARHEQDREDILREATALVERIELEVPGYSDPVIVGFRRNGSASVFIGADPVFQFNSKHELRRAYVAGKLIKAERGRLVSMEKRRTATQVQMLSTELDASSVTEIQTTAAEHMKELADHLREGTFHVRGQVPDSVDLVDRVRSWLEGLPAPITIAARPHAG